LRVECPRLQRHHDQHGQALAQAPGCCDGALLARDEPTPVSVPSLMSAAVSALVLLLVSGTRACAWFARAAAFAAAPAAGEQLVVEQLCA
jgi:hypothetical protein